MSTLEKTISMLEVLPETDLIEIQNFTKKFFQRHGRGTVDESIGRYLKPMSKEDFMKDVEIGEQEIANGKFRSAKETWNELERRYGL